MTTQPQRPTPPVAQQGRDRLGEFTASLMHPEGKLALALANALKTAAGDVPPDYWKEVLLSAVREKPELVTECDPASFVAAVRACAQLGLMPDARTGHAYFVPFRDGKAGGVKKVQFIVGYRGLMELALRTKKVHPIVARVVHAGDDFEYSYGLRETLEHRPLQSARAGREITHAYAIVRPTDEGAVPVFVVVDRSEIDAIRARSKASGSGPWVTDFAAMAAKTAVRQVMRWVPLDNPIRRALEAQLQSEADETAPRDVEWQEVTTENVNMALAARLSARQRPAIAPAEEEPLEEAQREEAQREEADADGPAPAPAPSVGEHDVHDTSPIGQLFAKGPAPATEPDPQRRKR